jgi:hypothetical protein
MDKKLLGRLVWTGLFLFFPLFLSASGLAQVQDVTPPSIAGFSFTPGAVDVSTGDQAITVTLRITDDLSGYDFGHVVFRSPSGYQQVVNTVTRGGNNLIDGDQFDGRYQTVLTIPQFSEVGEWYLFDIYVADRMNDTYYYEGDVIALGFPTKLNVTGTPQDTTPPSLIALSIAPSEVDTGKQDQTIAITMHITDDSTGFAGGNLIFQSPSGEQSLLVPISLPPSSGDARDRTYQVSMVVPKWSENGDWHVYDIYIADQMNGRYYFEPELSGLGFPTTFTVIGVEDTTPPLLAGFSFAPDIVNVGTEDKEVPVTLRITDDLLGFDGGYFLFKSPSGQQQMGGLVGPSNLIEGNEFNGRYVTSMVVPKLSENGEWQLSVVEISDPLNTRTINEQTLAEGGLPTTITIDSTPPELEIRATSAVLWPPNHKMVPVTLEVAASDNCDRRPTCGITSVTSNEPVDGTGDGDLSPDWEMISNLKVKLRAERSGEGSGRIYTILVTCSDAAGNSASESVDVIVPHDKRKPK